MQQLIWSPQALLDVQRLYRFLAGKNQDAAKRAVAAIRQGVKVLALQPGVGRPAEGMGDEFRDWRKPSVNSEYASGWLLTRRPSRLITAV